MNANLKVLALAAVFIAGIGAAPASGQIPDPVTVMTDKASYAPGDKILVTGQVRDLLSGQPIALKVTAPNGNIIGIEQLNVDSGGMFSVELTPGGPMWKVDGTYTVGVTYGSQARTAEATFAYGGALATGTDPVAPDDRISITIEEGAEPVDYSISGGTVIGIMPDEDQTSLIITINSTEDGSITLSIPRTILGALYEDGTDDDFFVLVDGEEVQDYEESITGSYRTLTIQFQAGTEEIEIIGTYVIPEFGTVAAMILGVAIISIIAVTARSRLSIMPRH